MRAVSHHLANRRTAIAGPTRRATGRNTKRTHSLIAVPPAAMQGGIPNEPTICLKTNDDPNSPNLGNPRKTYEAQTSGTIPPVARGRNVIHMDGRHSGKHPPPGVTLGGLENQ